MIGCVVVGLLPDDVVFDVVLDAVEESATGSVKKKLLPLPCRRARIPVYSNKLMVVAEKGSLMSGEAPVGTLCDPGPHTSASREEALAILEKRAEEAARLLAALGQSKRLMALCRLMETEMSVGALAEAVGLGQSALSQHLARLRDLGLVATRREGQTIYYRLASDNARRLIELLYELYCR